MINKTLVIRGQELNRVSKAKARWYFDAGSRVLCIRNKAVPSEYMPFFGVISKGSGYKNFDTAVNAFEYYNSEPELGNRTEFYIFA